MKLVSGTDLGASKPSVTVVWGHHMVVEDYAAISAGLQQAMIDVVGESSKATWSASATLAIDRLITQHATSIRDALIKGWRTNSLTRAAARKPLTRAMHGLRYTLDHPATSSPFYQTATPLSPTTYQLAAPSTPNAFARAACYGVTHATLIMTTWTSLLSVKVQLLALPEDATDDLAKTRQQLNARYDELLAGAHPLTLFAPMDFIGQDATSDMIVIPRDATSFESAMVGARTVAPRDTSAYQDLESFDQANAGWYSIAAELTGLSASEANALLDTVESSATLRDDPNWLLLPNEARLPCDLTSAETELLLTKPQQLLAMAPFVLRRGDGSVSYTAIGYASTIYRLSQTIATLRNSVKYKNDWVAVPMDSPSTIYEYLRALEECGQQGAAFDEASASRVLIDMALDDVKLKFSLAETLAPRLQRAVRTSINEFMVLPHEIPNLIKRRCGTDVLTDATWDRTSQTITLVRPQLDPVVIQLSIERARGNFFTKTGTLMGDLLACTEADRAEAWRVVLAAQRVIGLFLAAADMTHTELVENGRVRMLVESRAAMAKQMPGVASARDRMFSPFIYDKDAGNE